MTRPCVNSQTRCCTTRLQTSGPTPTCPRACTACRRLTPGSPSPPSRRAWRPPRQAPTSWLQVPTRKTLLGGSGACGTPGEGYEGTVGGYLQQQQAHLVLQQHSQFQQLQHLQQYQHQQFLQQLQQQQVSDTSRQWADNKQRHL